MTAHVAHELLKLGNKYLLSTCPRKYLTIPICQVFGNWCASLGGNPFRRERNSRKQCIRNRRTLIINSSSGEWMVQWMTVACIVLYKQRSLWKLHFVQSNQQSKSATTKATMKIVFLLIATSCLQGIQMVN